VQARLAGREAGRCAGEGLTRTNVTPRLPRSGTLASLVACALALVLTACPKKTDPKPDPASTTDGGIVAPDPKNAASETSNGSVKADAAHGKELVAAYQCNRCHEGTGHPAVAQNKHCVHCHKDIMEDRFSAPAASLARWKPRVKELADAPSLEALGKRTSRRWIEDYLLLPTDLRPHLQQSMPRLAISAADARDIAAYLAPDERPRAASAAGTTGADAKELAGADVGKGRQLLDAKGCGACHTMTGVAPLVNSSAPAMDGKAFERAFKLAPDLRAVRERTTAASLLAWLKDPQALKPDSAMPKIALSDSEAKDIAAYILGAEVGERASKPRVTRLPVLTRKVTYKEVDEKVFHRTCWHCHSEPDYAIGDGGPGNSGGLGFKPRGLNLSAYAGIAAGYVDDAGERQSVFAKDGEGVPRLVRAMLARHDEEAGAPTGPVRGMPLGYAPASLEEIQLVETWIAQGRPK